MADVFDAPRRRSLLFGWMTTADVRMPRTSRGISPRTASMFDASP
jgi:hypothetical protein